MAGVTQHFRRYLSWALVAAVLGSTGCMYTGWPFRKDHPGPVLEKPDVGRTGEGGGDVASSGPGWKAVSGKREPTFLIARDGSECMVSRKKWEDAVVGEKVLCIWGPPGK